MDRDEHLTGGRSGPGAVIRRGDVVHRSRQAGSDVVEALLVHLEARGFEGAPRFVGHDDEGHQMLTFVAGTTYADQPPAWTGDDDENASVLGRVARLLGEMHAAAEGFEPPPGAEPLRALPLPGAVWNHGDVHYGNVVFRGRDPVALIDWEFPAPAARTYDPLSLLLCARCPKPGEADNAERGATARRTLEAVADAYGFTDSERTSAPEQLAAIFDDFGDYLVRDPGTRPPSEVDEHIARLRWQADWWRSL